MEIDKNVRNLIRRTYAHFMGFNQLNDLVIYNSKLLTSVRKPFKSGEKLLYEISFRKLAINNLQKIAKHLQKIA